MMRMAMFTLLFCGLVACNDAPEPELAGELGNGTFTYLCGPKSDAQCDKNADPPWVEPDNKQIPFPWIAVGGLFNIRYASKHENLAEYGILGENFMTLETVTADAGADDGGGGGDGAGGSGGGGDGGGSSADQTKGTTFIRAMRSGTVAIFGHVRSTYEELAHLKLVTPTDIQIASEQVSGELSGSIGNIDVSISASGTSLRYRAAPISEDGQLLAGALPCKWSLPDEDVIRLSNVDDQSIVYVDIVGEGETTLTVKLGDLVKQVSVTVGGS